MYAMKLIVDLVEPKELRIAIQSAITVEHNLNPVLQSIVDKLLIPNELKQPEENLILEGGGKNAVASPKTDAT